ncbi:MAG: hypothetical protein HQM11_02585 [SAR324 cluster bacterium]|nr:hypothetical protein [SAR324 cluster bacterium]
MKTCVVFIIIALNLSQLASVQAGEFRRPGQGIRNLGMGNTGVALSSDENALQYNPAGLAGIDEMWITTPVTLEISQDSVDLVTDAQNIGDAQVSDLIGIGLNKQLHLRFYPGIALVVPFDGIAFGASTGMELQFDFIAKNPVLIEIELGLRIDMLQSYGLGFELDDGHWLVGVAAHTIERCDLQLSLSLGSVVTTGTDVNAYDSLGCSDLGFNADTGSIQGLAKAQTYDIGFQRRMESASSLRMIFGMVAKQVTGMNFSRKSDQTTPLDEPMEIDAGLSFQPQTDWIRMLAAIDLKDLTMSRIEDDPVCQCLEKRLHLGMEIGFNPLDTGSSSLALRAGFNQGYFTYGIEFNPFIFFRFITIQAASYTVERGTSPGDNPENRKVVQISFNL